MRYLLPLNIRRYHAFFLIEFDINSVFVSDEIMNELTPIMKKYAPRRIPVPDILYEYFIMRSRANLHVVLCFSPVSLPNDNLSFVKTI